MFRWSPNLVVLILAVALLAGSAGFTGAVEAAGFKWYNPTTWMNDGDRDQETLRQHGEPKTQPESLKPLHQETRSNTSDKAFKWYNPTTWMDGEEDTETRLQREAAREEARKQAELKRQQEEARRKAEKEREKARKESEQEKQKALTKAANKGSQLGALIQTQRGNITITFFENAAPVTVENFKRLVEEKFYDNPNMAFHRVVPGFVVQTGDPTGTGYGGSKKTIPLEVDNKLMHDTKGVVAMARGARPDSATSQFYITLAPQKQLDGKYAIFGQVVSGLDVLDKIEKGDKVYGVKLIDVSDIVQDRAAADDSGMFKKIFTHPF